MAQTNPQVDAFVNGAKKWQAEYKKLREIVLATDLTEEFKWMHPCYSYEGKNVLIIHGFKEYCAILFVKGVLLKDPAGVLITQTENVQSARQVRFTELDEIIELEPVLKAYIHEAIEVEKAGLKVEIKPTSEFVMPDEFKEKLDTDATLKAAFEGLTPGRQRAYLLHFSAPKQSGTRSARVEKCIPQILAGKGLND
ncbi:MAG: YdeI family protein [Anaerolineaceae bacterium]|nr:YdeI family protein [Anaerolineaceae bacterium]